MDASSAAVGEGPAASSSAAPDDEEEAAGAPEAAFFGLPSSHWLVAREETTRWGRSGGEGGAGSRIRPRVAQGLVCASLREIKRETERKGAGGGGGRGGHLIREEKRRVHSVSCADVCAGDTAMRTIALPLPERHGCRTRYVSLIVTEGRTHARTRAHEHTWRRYVSLLLRKGTCDCFFEMAVKTSPSADKDLFMLPSR